MSEEREGFHLTIEEIAAVLAMGGKQKFVGFRGRNPGILTEERMLNACCAMLRDGIMTQIDGKFRLRRDLWEVMLPVYTADSLLLVTPADEGSRQLACYGSGPVTVVEPAVYGGYSLTAMEAGELAGQICRVLSLECFREEIPAPQLPEEAGPGPDADREELLRGAVFVLEQISTDSNRRLRWLRCILVDGEPVLQWRERDETVYRLMTESCLQEALREMMRGVTES